MKRKGLMYALPLTCVLATAAGVAAADDSGYSSGRSASDPGYTTTTPSDRSMNADPSRPSDNQLPSDRSSSSSSGMGMKDAAITAKVKSALLAERDLPSSQIKVETTDGVVQLSGFLNSQDEINRAVSVASNIKDVKSVENNMQTK